MTLEACLPPDLRGPTTTFTKIAAGASGAGVYRVEAAGVPYVLKVSGAEEPAARWRTKVQIQRAAADAGVAPRVVHADEERRGVLSELVADRSFPAYFEDPRTRAAALEGLGRALRRVHELPVPPDAAAADARALLGMYWSGRLEGFPLPAFVGEAVRRMLAEEPPPAQHAPVLCHNDVNPTNLAYDGERILLLDWETAGPNDPLYDLAAIAVYLRMDDATCLRLIAAHDGDGDGDGDGAAAAALPARFAYFRRLVAVVCGAYFLYLARQGGHAGAAGAETLDSAPAFADIYQRLRSGALDIGAPEGRWRFGLALIKESYAL